MDRDFCGSDTGDGCGRSFPNKSSPGLCAKCTKLASFSDGSTEYEQWKGFRQCESCGVAWKNLDSPICGRCASDNAKAATPQQGVATDPNIQNLARTAIEASRAARSHAMDARITKQPVGQQLHTTADNNVFITAQCRIKSTSVKDQKTTDPSCGQWGKPWPKDAYMSVLDEYLATLNVRWSNEKGMALIPDEVEFRWAGNKLFLPGDVNKPVGEVYDTYLTGDMARYYSAPAPTTKKAAGSQPQFLMALELYIDQPKFMARRRDTMSFSNRGAPAHSSTNITTTFRKRSATATEINDTLRKRHTVSNEGGPMESTFVRTNRANLPAVDASTLIRPADPETGEVEIVWPDNSDMYEGVLGKDVFATGATKNVYKVFVNCSELYVAKRFFEIGSGTMVTANENKASLENELIRLKNAEWFLAKFKDIAKENGVEFSSNIIISDGFLIREMGMPSPASSFSSFEKDTAVWLVEPRRTKAVRKFSGTLVHPTRRDKLGQTLSAFTHFVYEYSGKELVFADIQGSPMTIQNVDTFILFDPMSHSRQSDSGIGDHGLDGIATFTAQHTCNYVCRGLKLATLSEDKAQDSDEDEEDADK
ncbi:kinase-like domain-containing protein [Gymnopilus junonius]|uniref:Kinase-like domain-containing protein n=1 Tax=Gymnopilus junonius TaxID=109634 RepID=A0A9P5NEV5_GYMJU|nr:kinase-like domain-containing protein [Gymnopilus junonius]